MPKILVVDDELPIRESFSLVLGDRYKTLLAASGEGALKTVTDQKIDLAYLDIRMPGLDGLETLKRMKQIDPELEVIMVTAVNDVQKAAEAIKLGARDYIIKPFDVDTILKMTDSILRRKSLLGEGEAVQKLARPTRLIGQSEKIVAINKSLEKIAAKEMPVLIAGERGTEKETLARAIHENSAHKGSSFQAIDLSASMSAAEIKTKLFGKGSGTTTIDLEKIIGLFEKNRGGTVFINNSEFLPAEMLSLLPADVRFIAGSSSAVIDRFWETVFTLPPLRERTSDLPLLIEHFAESWAEKYGKDEIKISPEASEILANYSWPGNTEELSDLLERLIISSTSDEITAADLPVDLLLTGFGSPGSNYLAAFEKSYIRKISDELGGDKEKVAAALKVSPAFLE